MPVMEDLHYVKCYIIHFITHIKRLYKQTRYKSTSIKMVMDTPQKQIVMIATYLYIGLFLGR
ncbi:MAG: hypothetical protein CL916_07505 [Deltaproteobacteria bacterium]|nr:hypothetical protein [Deltaproteobacteria bacterium]